MRLATEDQGNYIDREGHVAELHDPQSGLRLIRAALHWLTGLGWVRPATILLTGFVFAKLVCLGCGLAVGRPDRAVKAILGVWFGIDFVLNAWELLPFAALAGVDAGFLTVRPPV